MIKRVRTHKDFACRRRGRVKPAPRAFGARKLTLKTLDGISNENVSAKEKNRRLNKQLLWQYANMMRRMKITTCNNRMSKPY